MTRDKPRNLAASVRQRLMNIAQQQREDFQLVLTRYGVERLLYRLAQSRHGDIFVLKGAALFLLWGGHAHRPTRDVDLLGVGEPSTQRMEQIFRDVCDQYVTEDGLTFGADTVAVEQIKEDDEYQGIRVRLLGRLGKARISIQVDIGFGDAITPAAAVISYPTLLDFPAPSLRVYPRETVVAEKFQAMVMLGMANSRMKDFYDLWTLARQFEFDGPTLCLAIRATFDRRQTPLPESPPLALTNEFCSDPAKQTQWQAFLRKGKLQSPQLSLDEVVGVIAGFVMPPTLAMVGNESFQRRWPPGGPWANDES